MCRKSEKEWKGSAEQGLAHVGELVTADVMEEGQAAGLSLKAGGLHLAAIAWWC